MAKYSKSRDFVFTLNNYEEADIQKLMAIQNFIYIIMGKEIAPTTGTPHLQGYLCYKSDTTELNIVKQIKKAVNKQPYVAIRSKDSTSQKAIAYCKKDKPATDIFERGNPPIKKNNVNKLAENHTSANSIITQIKEGKSMKQLMEDNEKEYLKYGKSINELYKQFHPKAKGYSLLDEYKQLRPFQNDVLELVKGKPSLRTVLWIYDSVGNTGKSQLADHIADNVDNFIVINNGKTSDIAYLWKGENVIIDLSRTTSERVNYEIIEQLKNGRVFSTKYESVVKRYNRPHVIVLSNFLPDIRTMSEDRWDIREINKEYQLMDITSVCIEQNKSMESQLMEDYETSSNTTYSSDDLDHGIGRIKLSMRKNLTV